MKFYVHKNPDLTTLAKCRELPDDAPSPGGSFELMTLAAYDAWMEEQIAGGWAPPPTPTPPPIVPVSVTPLQMRRALRAAGLKATVDAALASASEEVREEWEFASQVSRDNPTLGAMASALNLTSTQVDNLFILAETYR